MSPRKPRNVAVEKRNEHRAYRCPRCGGEYDKWDDSMDPGDINIPESACPFCGTRRGNYAIPPGIAGIELYTPPEQMKYSGAYTWHRPGRRDRQ